MSASMQEDYTQRDVDLVGPQYNRSIESQVRAQSLLALSVQQKDGTINDSEVSMPKLKKH